MMVVVLVSSGVHMVSVPVSHPRGRADSDRSSLFSQHSDDSHHSASPVSLRAAFVSSPRYHHNTCPANLATTGCESIVSRHRRVTELTPSAHHLTNSQSPPVSSSSSAAAAAAAQLVFDAPALAEETLLDVSHCSAYYPHS